MILIIWIGCDICNWHCLETRDGFYPVDNSRNLVETSVDYYPVAHSRHFDEHIRVVLQDISHSQNYIPTSLLLATKGPP